MQPRQEASNLTNNSVEPSGLNVLSADNGSGEPVDMEVDMDMSDGPADTPKPSMPAVKSEPPSNAESLKISVSESEQRNTLLPSADISSQDNNASTSQNNASFRQVKTEPKAAPQIPKLKQTHAIVMPSYAAWFSLTKIHEVEKRSLPEFFNNRNRSKTPDIYMRYRNFMVNTYRLNPAEYLTVTACRRNLIGDVCTIMRVHNFLDKWGIINYQVDVEALPANVVPPFTGHWNVLHDTPRGLFPFKFYKGQDDPSAAQLPGGRTLDDVKAAAAAVTASTATSTTSTSTEPDKEDRPTIDPGTGWSKKELLLLLAGVEKFSTDWNAISEHVGTKDRHACIIKFLSLSIEDPYLGKSNSATNGSINGVKQEDVDRLGPLKYDVSNVPFSQADNPVMSVVSFLAGLVDPKVVVAAANRSITAIKEVMEEQADDGKETAEEPKEKELKKDDKEGEVVKAEKPIESTPTPAKVSDTFLESAGAVAFGAIGARSEVIRGHTARQMYTNLFKLVSQQLAKNEIKLKKFNQLENTLEIERRELEKEREEIFLDRLALHKKVRSVDELLSRAVQHAQSGSDPTLIKSTIEEASRVVSDGAKLTLSSSNIPAGVAVGVAPEDHGDDSLANGSSKTEVQPVSVELPQTYKYWSI